MIRNERTKGRPQPGRRAKVFLCLGATLLALTAAGTGLWLWRFRTYTPVAVAQDIRAAIQARHAPRPAERFLELRYGPLTEPANRQKAFLDFFNVDHIEGLYQIVGRIPAGRKQQAIGGMAQWVADYRRNLTPEEKDSLRAYLTSDAGRATLQKATGAYLRRDVAYRSATAPVIAELMATLAEAQKP
jgi:hypothetical protein